jgi:hypothetical protein
MARDKLVGFDPDWTVAPAATLLDWLAERGIRLPLGGTVAVGQYDRHYLLTGWWITACGATWAVNATLARQPLTEAAAARLALLTGSSAGFWLNYERQYRADLAAGRKDVTHGSPPREVTDEN